MNGIQGTFESKLPSLAEVEGDLDSLKSDSEILKANTGKTKDDTDYFVGKATGGLGTVRDSVGYKLAEIDRHIHSYWRWYGKLAVPAGGRVAAEFGSEDSPFTITAGGDDFGPWVQIADVNDTPFAPGQEFFDIHKLHIESADGSSTYAIQISFGETGDGGIASKTYSTEPLTPQTNQIDSGPIDTGCKRQPVGTKVWTRCKRRGQTGGDILFYYGFHEYEG